MSLIRLRSRPRAILFAAFAMLLAAALTFVAAGLGAAGAASDEPSKPGPSIAEGTGRTIEQSTALTVPARAPAPGGRCPQAWSYFDNTVMHYGLCVPPGWGFSDFSSPDPMDAVPVPQLENLHLLGNAFPWVPGRLPFDVIQASGALDVELDLLPADARATGECEPTDTLLVGLLTFLTCEQTYDANGLPAVGGLLRALKVIVPLATTPTDDQGDDLTGARLLIVCRSRADATLSEVTTLWQIVRSVRPY
ncbi:MAG: hypothetical protein ACXVD8_11995 [Actinomycetota bacterium]